MPSFRNDIYCSSAPVLRSSNISSRSRGTNYCSAAAIVSTLRNNPAPSMFKLSWLLHDTCLRMDIVLYSISGRPLSSSTGTYTDLQPPSSTYHTERVVQHRADIGGQLRHDHVVAPVLAEVNHDQRVQRPRHQRLLPRKVDRLLLKWHGTGLDPNET